MKPMLILSNGYSVSYEKARGWHHVILHNPRGDFIEKVRCDSYSEALQYRRKFIEQARKESRNG